eukprot:ANDGO_04292.mRNA.1 hypothetical protein
MALNGFDCSLSSRTMQRVQSLLRQLIALDSASSWRDGACVSIQVFPFDKDGQHAEFFTYPVLSRMVAKESSNLQSSSTSIVDFQITEIPNDATEFAVPQCCFRIGSLFKKPCVSSLRRVCLANDPHVDDDVVQCIRESCPLVAHLDVHRCRRVSGASVLPWIETTAERLRRRGESLSLNLSGTSVHPSEIVSSIVLHLDPQLLGLLDVASQHEDVSENIASEYFKMFETTPGRRTELGTSTYFRCRKGVVGVVRRGANGSLGFSVLPSSVSQNCTQRDVECVLRNISNCFCDTREADETNNMHGAASKNASLSMPAQS